MDLEGQTFLFDVGDAVRRFPTRDELEDVLQQAVKLAVWKRHRGRPPKGMNWEDLYQEVAVRTLPRLKHFMHGGKKTLFEYTYCAACFVLIDIQRADLKKQPQIQTSFPLFDEDFSNHQHYETRARQIELHQWQAHDADPSNR